MRYRSFCSRCSRRSARSSSPWMGMRARRAALDPADMQGRGSEIHLIPPPPGYRDAAMILVGYREVVRLLEAANRKSTSSTRMPWRLKSR